MVKLHKMRVGHHEFLSNVDVNYYPYFSVTIKQRIREKKATNVVTTGEGGIGKTYLSTDICRVVEPAFTIHEVVFRYSEFMRAVSTTRMGIPICFDEPSYALSKREWYNEIQQALVKTIESFRFKVHPLFLPVINKALLDKSIRTYLIQFQIVMSDRGKGTVYRLYPSQFQDKLYAYEFCKLRYTLFDNNLCSKPTCLGCRKVDPKDKLKRCPLFRAQYERKKSRTQEERYKQAADDADKKESQNLSLDELEVKAMKYVDKFWNKDKGKMDLVALRTILRREEGIHLSYNKSYQIAKDMKYDYPKIFNVSDKETSDNPATTS